MSRKHRRPSPEEVRAYVVETCEIWLRIRGACSLEDIVVDTEEEPGIVKEAFEAVAAKGFRLERNKNRSWMLFPR